MNHYFGFRAKELELITHTVVCESKQSGAGLLLLTLININMFDHRQLELPSNLKPGY